MGQEAHRTLDLLKFELGFLQNGGYRCSHRTPWRPCYVFEDSPSCLNLDDPAEPHPCSECPLMQFVPEQSRDETVPCRFIPLGQHGENIDYFYRCGTQQELEEALEGWLRKEINRIEAQSLPPPPASHQSSGCTQHSLRSMCKSCESARGTPGENQPDLSTVQAVSTGHNQSFAYDVGPVRAAEAGSLVAEEVPLEQIPDQELLRHYWATAGNAEREPYVNELFRRNYSKVARWCLRFASDHESAADLAQEVFTKAYQKLKSFQGQSTFSTWLFSIARNHCLNFIRANARQATELNAEVDEKFILSIPDPRYGPHTAIEREASAKLVSDLLSENLDDTEKAVFTLHYGEELPLDAVTRLLGLENRSGAKAYIVSAKRKLECSVRQWKARQQHISRLQDTA
jgi:RNA polymerase sigma-70 factor (ECF subfamily)